MSLLENFSYFTVPTASKATLTACVNFYKLFGFEVVSVRRPIEAIDVDVDEPTPGSVEETWLHHFDSPTPGITIRILHDKDGGNNTTEKRTGEPTDADVQTHTSVWFASTNISKIEAALKEGGVPFKKVEKLVPDVEANSPLTQHELTFNTTRTSALIELYLFDPSGQLVAITNKMGPFSSRTFPRQAKPPVARSVMNLSKGGDFEHYSSTTALNFEPKRKIAVLTSGGDAPGMNAAVRAVVRVALHRRCEVYAAYEGYQGLVDGGDKIKKLNWIDVTGILAQGGTFIYTARCAEFRQREGRLKAAKNLIERGIDSLIVIGGDGSLTGADLFRKEWPGLVSELSEKGEITKEYARRYANLTIVGLVGSIDNDMSGTDITIGAFSSLHRICECVDAISSTATSHMRAFVVEVMGRHCGWLALMAAIATGADYLFIPEQPPEDNWENHMVETLRHLRTSGKRKNIVIVAEGAIDRNLKPISPEYVRSVLSDRLHVEARVTTLGHVQRGGTAVFFDRYLGTLQGMEAVNAVLRSTPDTPSPVIGMRENKVISLPLVDAVAMTKAVAAAVGNKEFDKAMGLRDEEFKALHQVFLSTAVASQTVPKVGEGKGLRIGLMTVGAPAGGMNAAIRCAVRLGLQRGHTPVAIFNGFRGLIDGDVRPLNWLDVDGWAVKGGSEIGTNRTLPSADFGSIACQLQRFRIEALMIVGGFEAFSSLIELVRARSMYPAFCIPMVVVPATVSNNVPGTDFSLGSDTALNAIVSACDVIRQSASASRKRVFVVEVQGGHCGYLATLAGLAAGSSRTYIPEEGISLYDLVRDSEILKFKYEEEVERSEGRVILRNEQASNVYTTKMITDILQEEGKGFYDCREAVLGHLQQGGAPSPLDRIRGTRFAVRTMKFLEEQAHKALADAESGRNQSAGTHIQRIYSPDPNNCVVIGLKGARAEFTPVLQLLDNCDLKKRRAKDQWWMSLRPLLDILSKYEPEKN